MLSRSEMFGYIINLLSLIDTFDLFVHFFPQSYATTQNYYKTPLNNKTMKSHCSTSTINHVIAMMQTQTILYIGLSHIFFYLFEAEFVIAIRNYV